MTKLGAGANPAPDARAGRARLKLSVIASRLAEEFTRNLCLRLCPLAGHPDHARIDRDDSRAKGKRFWLADEAPANRIVSAIIAADHRSRRAVGGLIIAADMIESERQVRHFADANGYLGK